MEWRDQGLIIGVKKHGETSVILEVMTREHGRHLGLVRAGRSKRMQPYLQMGNDVGLTWRARLDEHLGFYSVEPLALRTSVLMENPEALQALNHVSGLLHLLAEREPHHRLFAAIEHILTHLAESITLAELIVRFEILLLAECGFGLELQSCAATGSFENLAFVSPKSRRAVCRESGEPYRDRLLPFPPFLQADEGHLPGQAELQDGFKLSGYFLNRDLFGPRGLKLPPAREAYLAEIARRFT
jgi:DNA repair protein RecO (recombination protein O)